MSEDHPVHEEYTEEKPIKKVKKKKEDE